MDTQVDIFIYTYVMYNKPQLSRYPKNQKPDRKNVRNFIFDAADKYNKY